MRREGPLRTALPAEQEEDKEEGEEDVDHDDEGEHAVGDQGQPSILMVRRNIDILHLQVVDYTVYYHPVGVVDVKAQITAEASHDPRQLPSNQHCHCTHLLDISDMYVVLL